MRTHYCHNCGYMSDLPDATYLCWYCLRFWYDHKRLPKPSDDCPRGD